MKKIKNKIKYTIYNIRYPLFNNILLESSPHFSDNTKFFYDELIRKGINKKYKIYWIVNSKKKFNDIKVKNVKFVKRDTIRFKFLNYSSKVIIDCNQFIHKKNKNQLRIYLTHGSLIKVPVEYFNDIGDYNYLVVTSDFFKKIYVEKLKIPKEKVVCTGFPRDDYIFKKTLRVVDKKTIIWMPTYRNHKISKSNYGTSKTSFKYGVPCINNEDEFKKLNNKLTKLNMHLLIKLHPAEDTSNFIEMKLSNISIFDDRIFDKEHTNIYDYLNGFEALITDYSSIYYDYLITTKKIGLAIPDIDEYSLHTKLAFDNYKENIKGYYIESFDDLLDFVDYVHSKNDMLKKDRLNLINLYNAYNDGNSSERVIELMLKHLEGDNNEK